MRYEAFKANLSKYFKMGFRKTTKTSVRKDYGFDERGEKYYIRLSPDVSTINGLGPLPQEMREDIAALRAVGVL